VTIATLPFNMKVPFKLSKLLLLNRRDARHA
jgi:hypothetical protein